MPIPPGPTIVTNRSAFTRATTSCSRPSRPTIRAGYTGGRCGTRRTRALASVPAGGRPHDRCGQTITTSVHRRYIPGAGFSVAERLGCDVKPQTTFFNCRIGPTISISSFLLTAARSARAAKISKPARQFDRLAFLRQQSGWRQSEYVKEIVDCS